MDSEAEIQRKIMLEASKQGMIVFRNETGFCQCNSVRYGLCKGSSDIIGWKPVEITEEMIGTTAAIFTALEVKTQKGRPTKEQINFIQAVTRDGGYAGIVRSTYDVESVIDGNQTKTD